MTRRNAEHLEGLIDRSDSEWVEEDDNDEYIEDPSAGRTRELYKTMKQRFPSILAAFLLTFISLCFFSLGIWSIYNGDYSYAGPCFAVFLITGLPGLFVTFLIFKLWMLDPDYSWDMIPAYEQTFER